MLPFYCLRIAHAVEVAVTPRAVDARDRRPELVGLDLGRRERRALTRVRLLPLLLGEHVLRVRRVRQQVVALGHLAVLDVLDLAADLDERVREAVQLGERLRLRRLDHERARDGERQRRRVEVVVHEALRNVLGLYADVLEAAHVQDELVAARAVGGAVEDLVVGCEQRAEVVGVEDGHLAGELEALGAHHVDVHVRDVENRGGAERGLRDDAELLLAAGDERQQVLLDADGALARTAATVGDGEGLVEVRVGNITTDGAGRRETEHGVEVGAVDVHLAADLVHKVADGLNFRLEDAVRAGVRDHDARDGVLVDGEEALEVGHVRLAAGAALDDDSVEAGHRRGCGVRAVGAGKDEALIALFLAVGLVVGADGAETSVLTLGAAVGLQKNVVEAHELGEAALHRLEHSVVAGGLVFGTEGVQAVDLLPRDGEHLRGCVELHRARPERHHGHV
eukprot:PhM_4_TR15667/c0_g1_i1/m.84480